MWWIDPEYHENEPKPKEEGIAWRQQHCYHDWKETILILSKVYDCKKCGVKKEDYEKWEKEKF